MVRIMAKAIERFTAKRLSRMPIAFLLILASSAYPQTGRRICFFMTYDACPADVPAKMKYSQNKYPADPTVKPFSATGPYEVVLSGYELTDLIIRREDISKISRIEAALSKNVIFKRQKAMVTLDPQDPDQTLNLAIYDITLVIKEDKKLTDDKFIKEGAITFNKLECIRSKISIGLNSFSISEFTTDDEYQAKEFMDKITTKLNLIDDSVNTLELNRTISKVIIRGKTEITLPDILFELTVVSPYLLLTGQPTASSKIIKIVFSENKNKTRPVLEVSSDFVDVNSKITWDIRTPTIFIGNLNNFIIPSNGFKARTNIAYNDTFCLSNLPDTPCKGVSLANQYEILFAAKSIPQDKQFNLVISNFTDVLHIDFSDIMAKPFVISSLDKNDKQSILLGVRNGDKSIDNQQIFRDVMLEIEALTFSSSGFASATLGDLSFKKSEIGSICPDSKIDISANSLTLDAYSLNSLKKCPIKPIEDVILDEPKLRAINFNNDQSVTLIGMETDAEGTLSKNILPSGMQVIIKLNVSNKSEEITFAIDGNKVIDFRLDVRDSTYEEIRVSFIGKGWKDKVIELDNGPKTFVAELGLETESPIMYKTGSGKATLAGEDIPLLFTPTPSGGLTSLAIIGIVAACAVIIVVSIAITIVVVLVKKKKKRVVD